MNFDEKFFDSIYMFEASESARERASEKVGEAKKKTTRTPNMMHCILFGIPKILNDSKGNCFFGVGLPSLVWLYVFPLSFSPKNKKKYYECRLNLGANRIHANLHIWLQLSFLSSSRC